MHVNRKAGLKSALLTSDAPCTQSSSPGSVRHKKRISTMFKQVIWPPAPLRPFPKLLALLPCATPRHSTGMFVRLHRKSFHVLCVVCETIILPIAPADSDLGHACTLRGRMLIPMATRPIDHASTACSFWCLCR